MNENMDKNIKIKTRKLIFRKYRLIKKIGEGSFGRVYLGINEKTMEPVAIKLEPKSNSIHFLKSEALYLFMLKSVGIPKLKAYGTNKGYNILIETLLGESLSQKLKKYNNKLPLKDSLMIAIQVIERLEYLHSKYLIHRDIKPANLLVGYDDPYIIYLIDYGLCKKYRSSRTGKHVKFKNTKYYNGTSTYASLNALKGNEVSRRDDFESAAYMLIYLMKGALPWELIKGKTKCDRFRKIYEMKLLCDPEELCKDLPKEIMLFLLYSKSLDFEQEPDYKYCYSLFNNALIKNGFSNDLIFSWIKDPKIIKKLKHMREKKNRNLETLKRRASPQTRLFRSLLNSFESKKSKQSTDILDNLNKSKEKEFSINSYKSLINQTSNKSLNSNSINDYNLSSNSIIRSKLSNHKKYRKIFIQPISAVKKYPEKYLSANSSSKVVKINRLNQKVKTKNKIKIPIIKIKEKFMSRNKKNENIFLKNDLNDITKRIHDNNSVNNTFMYSTINSNFNNKKDISSNTTLNNISTKNRKGNTNFIKIIQNNIINSDINMIINYHNKKDIMQNNRSSTMKNSRTRNIVNLNDTLLKTSLKESNSKKIFQKKEGLIPKYNTNFIKGNDINNKILNNFSAINKQKHEARFSNLSKKNTINSVEEYYSKFIKESNKINNNNSNNSSNFQKSKSIKDNNLSLNFYSLLKENKNSNLNKLRIKNKSDIKRENTNQKYKHIIRFKNNVLFQRKINDYGLNNEHSKYKSKIHNKNTKFTISNVSYIYKSKENNNSVKQSEVRFRTFNNLGKHVKKLNNFI